MPPVVAQVVRVSLRGGSLALSRQSCSTPEQDGVGLVADCAEDTDLRDVIGGWLGDFYQVAVAGEHAAAALVAAKLLTARRAVGEVGNDFVAHVGDSSFVLSASALILRWDVARNALDQLVGVFFRKR